MDQSPKNLAKKYASTLKQALQAQFSLSLENLSLLEREGGAYFSEKVPDTLCVLIVDEEGGGLYLAKGTPRGEEIADIKCLMIA